MVNKPPKYFCHFRGILMKKLLPVIIAVVGLVIGLTVGQLTAPGTDLPSAKAQATEVAPETSEQSPGGHAPEGEADVEQGTTETEEESPAGDVEFEYVKLPQQFVIPVFDNSKVSALVVISLSLEILPATNELVFAKEPKLRDVFLQVMFKHAQSGGFDGAFTTGQPISDFKKSLRQAAINVLGETVHDVLITDMVKQDN